MKNKTLHGIIPYLVSPVVPETGEIKTDVLQKLSEDLIKKGVHGLSPLGSAGEVHYLNWEQQKTIVKTVIKASNGQVPVIPGVTAYTPESAIEQIRYYETLGVYGVVFIIDTYFKLSDTEIIHFIKTVAESVSCEIVLYNNPGFSNVDIKPNIVLELADVKNINYFKDATGETSRLLTIINKTESIQIFSASAHIPLTVLQIGGVGWMAGPACVFPKESVQLYQLACDEAWKEAMQLQKKLWGVNEIFKRYTPARSMKASLKIQGYDVGEPMRPLKPLNKIEKEKINHALKKIKKQV
ncbi:MAG TPA: dihydrodipicolinate synthase family protein [Pseudogracilibacillus sp.]|nr:dihydrodipicolinate synthase family protein [Pseudogracilibacillus sp.]